MKKIIVVAIILIVIIIIFLFLWSDYNGDGSSRESAGTTTIEVFFNNSIMDPEISCNKVFPVERVIEITKAPASTSLALLFAGPTSEEKDRGFFTSINEGVATQYLKIENGVAFADFNGQLEFQVGGSCRVSAIRAQIAETLKQFSTVKDVIISINGRTEDILQP